MARKSTALKFTEPGRTQQHFKAECDVNNIVRRFAETGIQESFARGKPRFEFCTNQSFHEAQCIVAEVNTAFAEMPAKVRSYFSNDPANYIAALDDPDRRDDLVDLGLAEPLPPEEITPPEPSQEPVTQTAIPSPAEPSPEAIPPAQTEPN